MKNTITMTDNREFINVYKKGKSIVNNFLVLYYRKNKTNYIRIGITINKKVGKAVVRNRIRRLLKENFRFIENTISKGYDIIFVARVKAKDADYYKIQKSMNNLLVRAKLINK